MGIRSSLSVALDALRRNPVLFVAAFLIGLVNVVLLGVQSNVASDAPAFVWSVASLLVQLVTLFFVGGAYAMASEAVDGETNLGTFVSAGKEHYLSLVGATLLLVGVTMVSVVAVVFLAIAAALGGAAAAGFESLGLALVVGIYLLGFLPLFFLQFYGPAVVVSGLGAVGSLKRSFGVVRRNLLATLGFDLVLLALGLVGSAPTAWLYATNFDELVASGASFSLLASLDAPAFAGYLVSTLLLSTLFSGLFYTYQVVFYEDITARTEAAGGGPTTADDAAVGGDR